MSGRSVVMLAVAGVLSVVASAEARQWEPLTKSEIASIERCGARVEQLDGPNATGRLYGAVTAPEGSAEERYSRGVAVVIGVSEYADGSGLASLPGVKRDVEKVSNLVFNRSAPNLGFDVLVTLTDENVTGDNVICLVEGPLRKIANREDDRVLFYWSGHGDDDEEDVSSAGDSAGYLPYHDFNGGRLTSRNALPMESFEEWASDPRFFGRALQVVFIIDACASGYSQPSGRSMEPYKRDGAPASKFTRLEDLIRDYRGRLGVKTRVVMTASDRYSEAREDSSKGGYFTAELVALLKGDKSAGDQNGLVDHYDLASKLRETLKHPMPQVTPLKGGDSVDVFILRPNSALLHQFISLEEASRLRKATTDDTPLGGPGQSTGQSGSDVSLSALSTDVLNQLSASCGTADGVPLASLDPTELQRRRGYCEAVVDITVSGAAEHVGPRLALSQILIELGRKSDPAGAGKYFSEAQEALGPIPAGDESARATTSLLTLATFIYEGKWSKDHGGDDGRMYDLALQAYRLGNEKAGGHFVAWLSRYGRGTQKDLGRALDLFTRSLRAGNSSAAINLGDMFASDEMGAPEFRKAKSYYLEGGALGSARAYLKAAQLVLDHPDDRDFQSARDEAWSLVKKAVAIQPNYGWGLNFKGWMLERGYGTEQNLTAARSYYELSRAAGYDTAIHNIGRLEYRDGNHTMAARLYRDACEKQQASSCAFLGDMVLAGEAPASKPGEALELFKKATALNADYGYAYRRQGDVLAEGLDVEQNPDAALDAYALAASKGDHASWRALAYGIYENHLSKLEDGADVQAHPRYKSLKALWDKAVGEKDEGAAIARAEMHLEGMSYGATFEELFASLKDVKGGWRGRADELELELAVSDVMGAVPRAAQMNAYARLHANRTPAISRHFAQLVAEGRIDAEAFRTVGMLPPWVYYEECGAGDNTTCYLEAAQLLAGSPSRDAADASAEADKLYSLPPTAERMTLIRSFIAKAEEKGHPLAFPSLIAFELGNSPSADRVKDLVRQARERKSTEALRTFATMLESGQISADLYKQAELQPPWDYYGQCGDLHQRGCYWSAVDSVLNRPEGAARVYDVLSVEQRQSIASQYLEKALDEGDPNARLAVSALRLAAAGTSTYGYPVIRSGSEYQSPESIWTDLLGAGMDGFVAVGRAVASLAGDRKLGFEEAFAAVRDFSSNCVLTEPLVPGASDMMWPPVGCGWSNVDWPNWFVGVAKTIDDTSNLRSEPDQSRKNVIAVIPANQRVIFSRDWDTYADGWVRVRTEDDKVGWLSTTRLQALQQIADNAEGIAQPN